jgi:hypothetical protein
MCRRIIVRRFVGVTLCLVGFALGPRKTVALDEGRAVEIDQAKHAVTRGRHTHDQDGQNTNRLASAHCAAIL